MNKPLRSAALTAALLLTSNGVCAVDIGLRFSGNLILPACSLNVDSLEQDIVFETYSKKTLMATGKGPAKTFYIDLTSCVTARKVSVLFSGLEEPLMVGALAIKGEAAGFAIALENSAGQPIKLNDTLTYDIKGGTQEQLTFKAQILKIDGSAIETGTFNALLNFKVSYP